MSLKKSHKQQLLISINNPTKNTIEEPNKHIFTTKQNQNSEETEATSELSNNKKKKIEP